MAERRAEEPTCVANRAVQPLRRMGLTETPGAEIPEGVDFRLEQIDHVEHTPPTTPVSVVRLRVSQGYLQVTRTPRP